MQVQENNSIKSQITTANDLLRQGDHAAVLDIFARLLEYQQHHPDMGTDDLVQLGNLAVELDERIAAINLFAELVQRYPDNPVYMNALAQAYISNGMLLAAKHVLEEAVAKKPEHYLSYVKLGYIAVTHSDYDAAIEHLEKAIQLKPSDSAIYLNLVTALGFKGRQEEGYSYAQKLVRMEPNKAESYLLLGRMQNGLGQFDEARASFMKAIKLDKTLGYAFAELASIKKYTEPDVEFLKLAEKALTKSMPAVYRAAIHFALGKMYDDCGDQGNAFENFRQGNLIARPPLQDTDTEQFFKNTHKLFKRSLLADAVGSDSTVPVFVVGMPRSGTTLIQQIIAGHPEAAGAGELTVIAEIAREIWPQGGSAKAVPLFSKELHDEKAGQYAEMYLDVLQKSREDAIRVVDKMPDNFVFLGLIRYLFPRARIIHAVRTPLDTCLSCYFQNLTEVPWSFDLEWIAQRYRFYRKAMDYWEKVFPENSIIRVEYEKLIANPEVEARKMIESIGLEWNPACMDFHKNRNTVSTASVWQVRQPVYSSSRRRWVRYAAHLEKLASHLQEYLDEEDIEEFKRQGIRLKKKWRLNPFA